MPERMLTLAEIAEQLRVSRWTIMRRLDAHPEIRRYKPGRAVLLDEHGYRQLKAAIECPSKPSRPERGKTGLGISGDPSTAVPESKSTPASSQARRRGKYGALSRRLSEKYGSGNVVSLDRETI